MSAAYGLDSLQETRFGASTASLQQAAAVLRARAARAGVQLRAAEPTDLAAAVVGAEAWMTVLGAEAFTRPSTRGDGAVTALGRILLRAGGWGDGEEPVTDGCVLDEALVAAACGYARWAQRVLGDLPPAASALRRAACDLSAAGHGTRLSEFAEVLALTADSIEQQFSS